MPKTPKYTIKKSSATQDLYRVRILKSARFAMVSDAVYQMIETNSKMSIQNTLPATPLILINGNRHKSSKVLLQL